MTHYVCGFMFSGDYKQVLLIKKKRPDWQAGKWNGIGGHVEDSDESPAHAMAREFREETGVETAPGDWRFMAQYYEADQHGSNIVVVDFYFTRNSWAYLSARTVTDEQVSGWAVLDVFSDWKGETLLPNIPTLIGHAIGTAYSGFTLDPLEFDNSPHKL